MDDGVLYVLKYIKTNEKEHKTVHNLIERLDLQLKTRDGTERTFFRSINKDDPSYPKVLSFGRNERRDDYLYRTLFDERDNVLPGVPVWLKSELEGENGRNESGDLFEEGDCAHSSGKKRAASSDGLEFKKRRFSDGDSAGCEEVQRLREEFDGLKAENEELKKELSAANATVKQLVSVIVCFPLLGSIDRYPFRRTPIRSGSRC